MGTNAWLITNGFLHSAKFDELSELFASAACSLDISLQIIKNSEIMINTGAGKVKENKEKFGESLSLGRESPDFVLFWDKDVLLARYLEKKGVSLFNRSSAIAVCDDKRCTHLALMSAQIPMPQTILAPMTYHNIGFSDLEFLSEIERTLGYPLVVKEAFGSFGEQVYLLHTPEELREFMLSCKCTELLFQQYVASSHGRDIRLQVVGDEVIGAMMRCSDTDFRANITGGGHMKAYTPSAKECEMAVRAARAVGADFAGVDLLFGPDGPLVCEINSNAHFKNLLDCTGVNAAEHIFRHIKGVLSL